MYSCTSCICASLYPCAVLQLCTVLAKSWPPHLADLGQPLVDLTCHKQSCIFSNTYWSNQFFITNTNKSINPSPSLLPHPHTPLPNGPTQIKVRVGGLSNLGWTIQANHYTHNKPDLYAVCEEEASPSRGTFVTSPRPRHLGWNRSCSPM